MTPHSKLPMGTVALMSGLPANLWTFTWSMIEFVQFNCAHVEGPYGFINYQQSRHSLHHAARNEFAETFIGDWLLMLDTDHEFEPDLLARLLNAMRRHQVDVASGLYLKKEWPHRPTVWKWTGEKYAEPSSIPLDEAIEIDAAGAGCLLINRTVFERIKEMNELPFSTHEFAGTTGEDFAFFKRCHMLGIHCALFPWIECHHSKVRKLSVEKDYHPDELLPGESEAIATDMKKYLPNARAGAP